MAVPKCGGLKCEYILNLEVSGLVVFFNSSRNF